MSRRGGRLEQRFRLRGGWGGLGPRGFHPERGAANKRGGSLMRVLTYNILEGAMTPFAGREDRFDLIVQTVRSSGADVVALQECTDWEKNDSSLLRRFEKAVEMRGAMVITEGFPIAIMIRPDLNIISASATTEGFWHGVLDVLTADEDGRQTRFLAAHLHPRNTSKKLAEMRSVLRHHHLGERTVLMGDFNSISHLDGVVPEDLAEPTYIRHSRDGALDFRVTEFLEASGFVDTYMATNEDGPKHTIPTPGAEASEFTPARLDYIFVSRILGDSIISSSVVDNEITQVASDHFPLLLELRDQE